MSANYLRYQCLQEMHALVGIVTLHWSILGVGRTSTGKSRKFQGLTLTLAATTFGPVCLGMK